MLNQRSYLFTPFSFEPSLSLYTGAGNGSAASDKVAVEKLVGFEISESQVSLTVLA